MNKKELIRKVVDVLHDNDVRKKVQTYKTTLHISDDNGNHSDFVVRRPERGLLLTNDDVTAVVDALISVVEDSLKNGEQITIHRFGTFYLNYRAPRWVNHPETGEHIDIPAHYIPKFEFANTLRMAARTYEMNLMDKLGKVPSPDELKAQQEE